MYSNPPRLEVGTLVKNPPLSLKILKYALQLSAWLAPKTTAKWINDMWFTPRRYPMSESARAVLDSADFQRQVTVHGTQIRTLHWGKGKKVLLVHGWEGRGIQLRHFIAPLVESGFEVILFDGIAHGETAGKKTNLPEFQLTLEAIAKQEGSIEAIVAHSFGCAAAISAVHSGLACNRLVCISPSSGIQMMLDTFQHAFKLPQHITRLHVELMEEEFGNTIWQRYAMENLVPHLHTQGLIIHDEKDHLVTLSNARFIHHHWPQSQLVETSGLGHHRILGDAKVIQQIAGFLTSDK